MRALLCIVTMAACGSAQKGTPDSSVAPTTDSAMSSVDAHSTIDSSIADAAQNDAAHTPDASMASGCGTTPAAVKNPVNISYGNTTRMYDVYVPAAYDKNTPLSLTFAFHGAGGTAKNAEQYGIQNASGASAASIFVFPYGIQYKNDGIGWDDTCGGYDMVFFDHMVAEMESTYCIDKKRIYVAGFSWGCDFVTALDCCRGNVVRAVSAASCTDEYSNPDDYKTYDNLACPTKQTAGLRFTHDASGGDSAYKAPLFTTTSKLYQFFNGCPSFTGTLTANACHTYSGCTDEFIECPYTNLGHTPPPNWGNDTWSFFASFKQ